jgi:autotransporter-associated beta strand protein
MVMKRIARQWVLVCATVVIASVTAWATDGTWVSLGGGGGSDYGRTNNWLNGEVAGGAGATLYSTTWAQMDLPVPALNLSTNVVLGNLVVPDNASVSATIVMSPGFGAYGHTESLILDSGAEGVPATLQNNCVTNKARLKIRSDIRLQSDLFISYNPTNRFEKPNTAVYLTGDISEDGARRGLTVLNLVPGNQVSLFGDNTFSGDIEVKQGIVRAQSYTRLGGEGHQFGRDNTLIATNADSQIDLGGFTFGTDQSLLLSGCGVGGMGVLAASQQSPCYTSVWSGPITLAGDSAVGMGYCKSYPRAVGSALALTGVIGDAGAGRTLIKNSPNALFLRGTNTYSGGTIVSNGYVSATCKENFGTGPLIFAGGAFLFETPWDITSEAGLVLTNKTDVRLRTADQNVTFNGVLGPFGGQVYKSGLGTLTLTRAGQHQNLHICSGAVNLDYSVNSEAKLPAAWYVNLYNNASLNIIGGAQPFTNTIHSLNPQAGCAGVVSISGAAGTRFNLEGAASCGVGAGESLDLLVQEGATLSLSRSGLDASVLNTRITYNGAAFVSRIADGTAIPYASASTDWDTVTALHMDVLADTPTAVPADAKIRTLRFSDPAAGQLTLGGDTGLSNGAILVTPAMGSTAVHIQGGTLTSTQGNELTVHQYNTQAVLRISSVLTNTPAGGALTLTKTGPGTLVLSDVRNTFSGTIYVIGGTLEIESGQAFGATNRYVYVYNGATLRLRGQQIFGVPNSNSLLFNEAGGRIDVPDAGDRAIFIGRTGAQAHGLLTKTGKGMLTIAGNWSMMANESFLDDMDKTFVVEEGTLDISKNLAGPRLISGEKRGTVVVKNNAVLRGALFLSGNGATNGGGSSEDEQGGYHMRVEATGGIVDLDGVSVNMGVRGDETYSCDFVSGPGRLTITNTSGTAATVSFYGSHLNHFTGVFDGARYYTRNVGGGIPNGEFPVPEDVAVDFGWVAFPQTFAIGRLTGSGLFGGKSQDNQSCPPLLVGSDADEAFEYSGFLWGTFNSGANSAFPFRYTKVGSNAWRIAGTTNAMTSDVTIRSGTILVGADSPGQGAVGALGKAKAVLGDAETGASDAALLTDGSYTVGNSLVLSTTGGDITLGGNQTTGASLFTSDLTLPRDVVLTSANTDENGVTFSGTVSGPGGITKTGVGTVYLTGVVSNTGPTAVQQGSLVMQGDLTLTNALTVTAGTGGAGTLAVNGNLTLGAGAELSLSVAGTLVLGQTYTLMTWTGARTGMFASVTGLPADWHVGYRSNSVVLYFAIPGTIILVQ